MKTNQNKINPQIKEILTTHEGGKSSPLSNLEKFRRSVMCTMLNEETFYEAGEVATNRIKELIPLLPADSVYNVAIEAKTYMKLRHVPLMIAIEMLKYNPHKNLVPYLLSKFLITRADELSEVLAMYEKANGHSKFSNKLKKGVAMAFPKFDEYSLQKYNRKTSITLADALKITHPKPINNEQAKLWKSLMEGTLKTPETWETQIKGENKKETWEKLLSENKLQALAFLRNLNNFNKADVSFDIVKKALQNIKFDKILPFQFVTAARYYPRLEKELGEKMLESLQGAEKLEGRTVLLVDHSGSMKDPLSEKSSQTRSDVAKGLAILLKEICSDIDIATFSRFLVPIGNSRTGFALADAIDRSQEMSCTDLAGSLNTLSMNINMTSSSCERSVVGRYDRIIVITDEQTNTNIITEVPIFQKYIINIANYSNGIEYNKGWTHINGWSEKVIDFIKEYERNGQR